MCESVNIYHVLALNSTDTGDTPQIAMPLTPQADILVE